MKFSMLVFPILALAACIPAAAPAAFALGTCEAGLVEKGLPFPEFVAESVLECGDDMLSLVDALLASKDPAYARYKAEALEAKQNPAKMNALKAHVAARRTAAARGQ